MFAMGPAFTGGALAYPLLTLAGTYTNAVIVGTPYSSDLTIGGGNGVYALTGGTGVTSGTLPAGLSLSIVSGKLRLSGTPTGSSGAVSFTAGVTSGDGQTVTSPQSVNVLSGFAAAVLSLSPFGYWRMNDTTSTVADISGNGQNGTWNAGGGTFTQSQPSLLPSGSGNSTAKTGTARVNCTFTGGVASANWSMVAAIKPSSFPGSANVFMSMANGAPQLGLDGSGHLVAGRANVVNYTASTTALVAGVSHLVGVSVSGSTGTYYVDGVAAGTFSGAGTGNAPLVGCLGTYYNGTDHPFIGSLQELAYFQGVALSATDWSNLWAAS